VLLDDRLLVPHHPVIDEFLPFVLRKRPHVRKQRLHHIVRKADDEVAGVVVKKGDCERYAADFAAPQFHRMLQGFVCRSCAKCPDVDVRLESRRLGHGINLHGKG
jgi:hypothetical protein